MCVYIYTHYIYICIHVYTYYIYTHICASLSLRERNKVKGITDEGFDEGFAPWWANSEKCPIFCSGCWTRMWSGLFVRSYLLLNLRPSSLLWWGYWGKDKQSLKRRLLMARCYHLSFRLHELHVSGGQGKKKTLSRNRCISIS